MDDICQPSFSKNLQEFEVKISNLRLSVKCWGNPKDEPMLAFHGWLDNAATFDNLAPLLNQHRVISIDLPGHGFSQHRPVGSAYHFSDLIIDIIEVIDVLCLEKVSLLGHSMGAGVASYLAGCLLYTSPSPRDRG